MTTARDIARHLIETETALLIAYDNRARESVMRDALDVGSVDIDGAKAAKDAARAAAKRDARRIVAGVFGDPCENGFVGLDSEPPERLNTDGETCLICGWPRGHHA
jgi:hypothetical protein